MDLNYTIAYFPNPTTNSMKQKLEVMLAQHGFVKNETDFEYVFIIGGDGTFLKYGAQYLNQPVKIIMINSGNIGFFSSCHLDELEDILVNHKGSYQPLHYLDVKVHQHHYVCVNEVTAFAFNTDPITVSLDAQSHYTFNGSGFVVSTPLGSSGSNKSNRGPLVDPSLNCYILSELLSVNNNRFRSLDAPLVINGTKRLTISFDKQKHIQVVVDNQPIESDVDKIIIKMKQSKARLLVDKPIMFAKWNESFLWKN